MNPSLGVPQYESFVRFFPRSGDLKSHEPGLVRVLRELWNLAFFDPETGGPSVSFPSFMPRLVAVSAGAFSASAEEAERCGVDLTCLVHVHFEGGLFLESISVQLGRVPYPSEEGEWVLNGHRYTVPFFLRTREQLASWENRLRGHWERASAKLRPRRPVDSEGEDKSKARAKPEGAQPDERDPHTLRVLGIGDVLEDALFPTLLWLVRLLRRRLEAGPLPGTDSTEGQPTRNDRDDAPRHLRAIFQTVLGGGDIGTAVRRLVQSHIGQIVNNRNPLTRIGQRRELSFHGPGGVHPRSTGKLSLRDVHPNDLDIICPVKTPQGPAMGLRLFLARSARIDATARRLVGPEPIGERDPGNALGDAASLIPFVEHDDVARALMGANMMCQALPLAEPQAPLIQTGWEDRLAGCPEVPEAFRHESTLALGANLFVGYLPWGLESFEDGIIVSDSAVRALTSRETETLWLEERVAWDYREQRRVTIEVDESILPEAVRRSGRHKGGIIRPDTVVGPDDVLIGAIKWWTPRASKTELIDQLMSEITGRVPEEARDASLRVPPRLRGRVSAVIDSAAAPEKFPVLSPGVRRRIGIVIERTERLRVGDKLSGRHGNKGVVVRVLHDREMPFVRLDREDGPGRCQDHECPVSALGRAHRHLQAILNPLGVTGRLNIGQLYETALAKVAERDGAPIVVPPFDETWTPAQLATNLEKRGFSADGKEDLAVWDVPSRKVVPLRERVLAGPQYLLRLHHLAIDKVHARGRGRPWDYTRRDDQPTAGKPLKGGQRIGEMEVWALAAHSAWEILDDTLSIRSDDRQFRDERTEEREAAQKSDQRRPRSLANLILVLRALGIDCRLWKGPGTVGVDVTQKFLTRKGGAAFRRVSLDIATGRSRADWDLRDGPSQIDVIDPETGNPHLQGLLSRAIFEKWWHLAVLELPRSRSIVHPLVARELWDLFASDSRGREVLNLPEPRPPLEDRPWDWAVRLSRAIAEGTLDAWPVRETKAGAVVCRLGGEGRSPRDFLITELAILPPQFLESPDQGQRTSLLSLYRSVLAIVLPIREREKVRSKAGSRELAGRDDDVGVIARDEWRRLYSAVERLFIGRDAADRSLLGLLAGKKGLLRGRSAGKRVDFSGRAVIAGDPSVPLDEIRLPGTVWQTLFPDVTPGPDVKQIVLVNRQPTLHRYSVMAFHASSDRVTAETQVGYEEEAVIRINPFVCKGFNADFDGDTVALHAPQKPAARREAERLLPSAHLFSQASGGLVPGFGGDIALGAVYLCHGPDVEEGGDVPLTDETWFPITEKDIWEECVLDGLRTTAGRLQLKRLLGGDVALPNRRLDAKSWGRVVDEVARGESGERGRLARFAASLVKLLTPVLQTSGLSLAVSDFVARDANAAESLAHGFLDFAMRCGAKGDPLSLLAPRGRMNRLVDRRRKLKSEMGTSDETMLNSRPNTTRPILSGLLEGHDPDDYLCSAQGARVGLADKVLNTAPAGVLLRFLIYALQDVFVVAHDCGATEGLTSPVTERLASRFRMDGAEIRTGSPGVGPIAHRSPLYCRAARRDGRPGLCQTCYGLDPATGHPPAIGLPAGILAAQAIGERATQLKLRTFHTGGRAEPSRAPVPDDLGVRIGGPTEDAQNEKPLDLDDLSAHIAKALEVAPGGEADWVARLATAFAEKSDPPRQVHLEVILFGLRNRERLGGPLTQLARGRISEVLKRIITYGDEDTLTGVISCVIAGRPFAVNLGDGKEKRDNGSGVDEGGGSGEGPTAGERERAGVREEAGEDTGGSAGGVGGTGPGPGNPLRGPGVG